jgi:hypothetical protein
MYSTSTFPLLFFYSYFVRRGKEHTSMALGVNLKDGDALREINTTSNAFHFFPLLTFNKLGVRPA